MLFPPKIAIDSTVLISAGSQTNKGYIVDFHHRT